MTGEPTTGRPPTREERRAETRRRLLDAARRVFAAKGFHGATVEDIAAAAGFTKGAVYSNFGSKEDLFLAIIDDRIADQAAQVEAIGSQPDASEVQRDLAHHVRAQFERSDDEAVLGILALEFILWAARERADVRDAIAERYRAVDRQIAAMARQHWGFEESQGGLSADDLALAQSALGEGLAMRMVVDPEGIDPDRVVRIFQVLLGGPQPDERGGQAT